MAAVTHAVATVSTLNVTSYAAAAFTPVANDLLVGFVIASQTQALAATLVTDSGITFTLIGRATYRTTLDSVYVYIANSLATAVSMIATWDCTEDPATGCVIIIERVSGMTRTGSIAVRTGQIPLQNEQAAAATPTLTFASAVLTGNPTLGAVGNSTNPSGLTVPTGWTVAATSGYATPVTGSHVVFRNSGFTGTSMPWGSTSATAFGAIGIELDTSSPPPLADKTRQIVFPPHAHYRANRF